jgi:hypothetical protein
MSALAPLAAGSAAGSGSGDRGVVGLLVGVVLLLLFGWTMWRAIRPRADRDDHYDRPYDDREPDPTVDPDQDN